MLWRLLPPQPRVGRPPRPRPEVSAADEAAAPRRVGKRASAFRTIGEVAEDLDVPAHVLRFWESKFPQLTPLKRGGGRRYYRPEDVQLLQRIRRCLYQEGYTIRGVQRLLNQAAPDDRVSAVAVLAAEAVATLFPLEPLPSPAAPVSNSRRAAARALPPPVRTELEEIRRELLDIRALAERLRRGDEG